MGPGGANRITASGYQRLCFASAWLRLNPTGAVAVMTTAGTSSAAACRFRGGHL
jgi:hypothetical protein